MSEMPQPISYCLNLILNLPCCSQCSYDPVNNPKCPAYKEGHLFVAEVDRAEVLEGLRPKNFDYQIPINNKPKTLDSKLDGSSMQLEEEYFE